MTLSVAGAVFAGVGSVGAASTDGATGPGKLTNALAAIENLPRYKQSNWGYSVLDQKSGKVLAAQNDQKMFDPGSTMKTYSVTTALRLYGPDYTFHTPVYRQGAMSGGVLDGDLVLVGSGDLTFGLREEPGGKLYYENLPEIDHSYANTGLPGAVEPKGAPPLSALDELAAAVKAAGVTQVSGDVVVDNRLFDEFDGFPDGLISAIWVNENLIDVEVTPTEVGQTATIDHRPVTATYTVESQAKTVAKDAENPAPLQVTEPTPGHLVVTGDIPAGEKRLVVYEVGDPSAFARTAFIEALQRAGVAVTASPTGPNPAALLPANDSYQSADMVGEHVSTTLAEYVNLIMQVSYNRGADLMTCLAAVKVGSTDCLQGLVEEQKTITGFGIPDDGVFLQDGAGSDDQGRTTPLALAEFFRRAASTSYGKALSDGLPVMGRTGLLADVLSKSPIAGHSQAKTGSRVVGTPAGQIIMLGNSIAGYIQTKSGRDVTYMIVVGNVPLSDAEEVLPIGVQQARMALAIYQSL